VLSSCFHELQTQEVDSVNWFARVSGAKKGEFVTELECSLSMGMSAADTSPLNSFNHDLRVSGILYLRGVVCVVVVTGAGDYVVVFPAHNYHPSIGHRNGQRNTRYNIILALRKRITNKLLGGLKKKINIENRNKKV